MYSEGDGVEEDTKQKIYHLEQAAIAGHPEARYNLGMHERRKLSMERAMKHFIIAASNGHDLSMKKMVRKGYETGLVTKKDFASALRAHQAAWMQQKVHRGMQGS